MRTDPFSHLQDRLGGREDGPSEPTDPFDGDDLNFARGMIVAVAVMTALYFAIAVIVALT